MKIRGLILIALIIGGMYAMIQVPQEYVEKNFSDLLQSKNESFVSLFLNIPASSASEQQMWVINDDRQIENLLNFLQDYHVRKLNPEEINIVDGIENFSINLKNKEGDTIEIIVDENIIIQNSLLYYEIVDGPLNVDWLLQFFIHNKI